MKYLGSGTGGQAGELVSELGSPEPSRAWSSDGQGPEGSTRTQSFWVEGHLAPLAPPTSVRGSPPQPSEPTLASSFPALLLGTAEML